MKIIKIENCMYCPLSGLNYPNLICESPICYGKIIGEPKKITKNDIIPDWCPLDDYKI